MAKITIKGKKVKGTKKKDKITWQNKKAWKKSLTVNAGAGNDVINFTKSKYNNIFYGEAGNDKITGGTGNDKIYGGKGKDTISAGLGNNTIYFNKGDGTDTILNGGGNDNLVFAKETVKTLKAKISGNNIVLTGKKGKNTVILKNYMNSGHSAQYVTIGKKKVKVETLLPVKNITGNTKTINGTHLRDNITVNADEATVNALSGDDTINVYGTEFNINPGKGDDVINLLNPSFEPKRGTITINKGDGNNTINGIGDMMVFMDSAALTINSDGLIGDFYGQPYIFAETSNADLVLKLTSGEKLTFTNFLTNMNNFSKLYSYYPGYGIIPLKNLIRPEVPVIDIVANKTISINQDYALGSTVDNGKHTVNVNSKFGLLIFDKGTNTVNFNSIGNKPLFRGGTNTVNINASNNYPLFQAGTSNTVNVASGVKTSISFDNNDNVVTTAENTDATLWFQSEDLSKANKVYSYGKDSIINYGNTEITLSGDYDKYIEIESEIAITDIKGVTDAKSTDISYNSEPNTKDIAFSHYIANKDAEGNDFITILAKDENGNILSSKTNVWGKWTGNTFDLESLGKDKLKIGYYKGAGKYVQIGLNENKLTQYVDMAKIYADTGSREFDWDEGAGLFNNANGYYFKGTTNDETYSYMTFSHYDHITYESYPQNVVIDDVGGNDTLNFDMDAPGFFFDVKKDGNGFILGDDLIFTNNLSNFLSGSGNYNTITIKNGFGTGKIETITIDNGDYYPHLNYDNIMSTEQVIGGDSIWMELTEWLTTGNGKDYSSVSDALATATGEAKTAIVNDLTMIYSDNTWSYWTL